MPPESPRPSSWSEVPGEREVEDWIRLLPESWPPWKLLKVAKPEEFAQTVEEIIAYDLTPAFFASDRRRALESALPTPPIVLRDALFEGGKKGERKPLREDVAVLYQKVPLARFLLSCTSTQSIALIFRTVYFYMVSTESLVKAQMEPESRVALARAVYAPTKYVLLDDPLSAVVRMFHV